MLESAINSGPRAINAPVNLNGGKLASQEQPERTRFFPSLLAACCFLRLAVGPFRARRSGSLAGAWFGRSGARGILFSRLEPAQTGDVAKMLLVCLGEDVST